MSAVAAVADAVAKVVRKEANEDAKTRTYNGTPTTHNPLLGPVSAIANVVGPTVNPQFTE